MVEFVRKLRGSGSSYGWQAFNIPISGQCSFFPSASIATNAAIRFARVSGRLADKLKHFFAVHLRPDALRAARREFLDVGTRVVLLQLTVDPAIDERPVDRF